MKCSPGQGADSRAEDTQGSKFCWQRIKKNQKAQGMWKNTFNENFWYSSSKVNSTAGNQDEVTSVTIHEMFWNVSSVALAFISVDSLKLWISLFRLHPSFSLFPLFPSPETFPFSSHHFFSPKACLTGELWYWLQTQSRLGNSFRHSFTSVCQGQLHYAWEY